MFNKKEKQKNNRKKVQKQTKSSAKDNGVIVNGGLDVSQFNKKPKKKKEGSFLDNGSPVANFLSNLLNTKRNKEEKNALYKRYNSEQFNHSTVEHLAYKRLTRDDPDNNYHDKGRHYLVLADDLHDTSGYAEILKVGGTSLSDLPDTLVYERMSSFVDFLRSCQSDIKFVALPLPNDSRLQQHEWNGQLEKVKDTLLNKQNLSDHQRAQLLAREARIQDNLEKFKKIDIHLVNQGFVMLIFKMGQSPDTIKKLDVEAKLIMNFGRDALNLEKMSYSQKEIFLRHLNNPNNVQTM